jgi:hypothetical protein
MSSYIIAVDVGIKNVGFCVFDFVKNQVVHWDCISLVPNGRYIPSNNVEYVRAFVRRYDAFFSCAAVVLVERQMRCNMRIVESVLQSMYYDICLIVSPRAVKMHYDLSTKNYRTNKQKAVQWATAFAKANAHAFVPHARDAFYNSKKQDDLADSLLMVMYYLDTYSNQLSTGDVAL